MRTETNESRFVGRIDADTTEKLLIAAIAEHVGLSKYASGLSLRWTVGGEYEAPELIFNLVQDHR